MAYGETFVSRGRVSRDRFVFSYDRVEIVTDVMERDSRRLERARKWVSDEIHDVARSVREVTA